MFAGLTAFAAAWQALAIALVLLVVGEGADTSLSVGDFVAFTTAFGTTAAAILGLVSVFSTLTRLLLGFEAPATGTVSYDGQSLANVDAHAVRRQLGCVIPNPP